MQSHGGVARQTRAGCGSKIEARTQASQQCHCVGRRLSKQKAQTTHGGGQGDPRHGHHERGNLEHVLQEKRRTTQNQSARNNATDFTVRRLGDVQEKWIPDSRQLGGASKSKFSGLLDTTAARLSCRHCVGFNILIFEVFGHWCDDSGGPKSTHKSWDRRNC